MKKLIIKSNLWYEKLSNIKGSIFYLALIFVPYSTLLILINGLPGNISAIFWAFLVGVWRASYIFITEYDKIKTKQ